MVSSNFKRTLKGTSQAPRDQLDRCASLLRICMEAKRAANVSEDGVDSNKKMETTDFLVDQICEYVKLVAAAPIREEDWESVQQKAVEPVLLALPRTVALSMRSELENAVKKDEKTAKLCVKAKERIQELVKKSDRIKIKFSFLRPDSGPEEEEYEVKRRTPPSALATIVLLHRKQGRLPNFYHPHPELLINRSPADWTPKESIPVRLFVVMDRGRFEFKFKITMREITNTWVFRNIVVLQQQGRFYLKDSRGILYPAPDGDLSPDRIVCKKVQRPDQKRIEGPMPCKQWHETLERIITVGDDGWIVEPEPPPSPDLSSTNFLLGLPTLTKPVLFDTKAGSISATAYITALNSSNSVASDSYTVKSIHDAPSSHTILGGHTATRLNPPSTSLPPGVTSSNPHNPGSVFALNTSTSSSTLGSSTHHQDPLGDTSPTPAFSEGKAQNGFMKKVLNWARKKIGLATDKRRRS